MKRLFDILFSVVLLIVLLPVFVISIVGILLSDRAPVFYKAKRAGRNGVAFDMLKFRSMRVSKGTSSKITSLNDRRIFPFGKLIRFLKIDELPQLFNILKGDMSVIGPRPEDITIVHKYYDEVLLESLTVRPGLASPGSIFNYTHIEDMLHEEDAEDRYIGYLMPIKVKLDIVYCRKANIYYDFKLIVRTLKVIILKAMGYRRFKYPPEYFEIMLENRDSSFNQNHSD